MVKRKNKSNNYGIYFGILIVLALLGSFLIFSNETSKTTYFNSEDLGVIEITTSVENAFNGLIKSFFGLFQQAVTFATSSAEKGDTISLTDSHLVSGLSPGCSLSYLDIVIIAPSGTQTSIKNRLFMANNFDTVSTSASLSIDFNSF